MSMHVSSSRPATKSIGAALVGVVLTLVILVVVLLSFLIAPLLALGVALLAYLAIRPRAQRRASRAGGTRQPAGTDQPRSAFGFGAGSSS